MNTNQYAVRLDKKRMRVSMHRQIMNPPEGMVVDHINNNGLDNRKANLRIVTHRQNCLNSRPKIKNTTSRYKGVCWEKESKKWRALITHKGRRISIGRFKNEIDAAFAYDKVAKELNGQYAWLNFPCPEKDPH